MELVFLGTGSNNPTPHRNVSCTCFRYEGEIWLLDCGEATQIQLMKSTVKPGKITKIFITHLHGDHVFGLPGLMCTISQNVLPGCKKLIEIYGPVGLRRFIRTNLELSRSLVTYNYVVHELVPIDEQIPDEVKKWKILEREDSNLHPSEILGRQIERNADGHWNLFDNDKLKMSSCWIKHRVATFGYVIEEKPLAGKLNAEALKAAGVPAGPLFAKIKAGEVVKLSNGVEINPQDFVGPSRPGKKVTLLGDCCGVPEDLVKLAYDSDVLVHESTLEDAFKEKALSYGHSTPSMAADVAKRLNVKCLILNHFSQRYKPANTGEPIEKAMKLEEADKKDINSNDPDNDEADDCVSKLLNECKQAFDRDVYAAYDLWTFTI